MLCSTSELDLIYSYNYNEKKINFFYFISKKTSSPFEEEEKTDLGLVKGHAYGITDVRMIDLNENKWFKIFK